MATTDEWADAYLAQAAEDLEAAELVFRHSAAMSVVCMLLQMVFEKAAKAALLRSGQISVRKALRTHAAASILLRVIKRNRQCMWELSEGDPFKLDGILPLIQELERAHPALAMDGQPQLEYPWEDPQTRQVRWPAQDLPIVVRLSDSHNMRGPRLMNLAHMLVRLVPELF